MKNFYALGVDFGSASARALLVNLTSGEEIASHTQVYISGENGIVLEPNDPHVARQNPSDYLFSLKTCLENVVKLAKEKSIDLSDIVGIGVDATASTPLPVDKKLSPLAFAKEFTHNLNAYAWMWKDHTSDVEAEKITTLAKQFRPQYLMRCGGRYSSEWFWAKLLHCYTIDPVIYNAAYTWLELSDYIPAVLAGITNGNDLKRNICAAGHKAMYSEEWGGFPDVEFLSRLSPELVRIRSTLPDKVHCFDSVVGYLCDEWAAKTGLPVGIPISTGSIDAHVGAIGAGAGVGTLVKIIGTSSCDIMVSQVQNQPPVINGISGIVKDSVLPGFWGIEAGQAAFGDLYNWFIAKVLKQPESYHQEMTQKASELKAGETGLLCLDWNNGNRSVLADQNLTGLMMGQTINTRDFEIYRALIEATAFGALKIIERIETGGVAIKKVVGCGGIARKSPLAMQIFANIFNRPLEVAAQDQTVALGAAIMGGYAALKGNAGFESVAEIQQRVCKVSDKKYYPQESEVKVYSRLYRLYSSLHDAFGDPSSQSEMNMYSVMKELMKIREEVRD